MCFGRSVFGRRVFFTDGHPRSECLGRQQSPSRQVSLDLLVPPVRCPLMIDECLTDAKSLQTPPPSQGPDPLEILGSTRSIRSPRAWLPGSTDIAPRPITRSTACVCERELAADGAHLHDPPLRRSCMHMAECAGRVEGARTGTPAHVSATAAGTFVVAQIHITQRPHRALR